MVRPCKEQLKQLQELCDRQQKGIIACLAVLVQGCDAMLRLDPKNAADVVAAAQELGMYMVRATEHLHQAYVPLPGNDPATNEKGGRG